MREGWPAGQAAARARPVGNLVHVRAVEADAQPTSGFVQTRNDNNAAYNFNINPYTVVNGANANGFVVGLVHFF